MTSDQGKKNAARAIHILDEAEATRAAGGYSDEYPEGLTDEERERIIPVRGKDGENR